MGILSDDEWSQRVTEMFENLPDEVDLGGLESTDLLGVIEPPKPCTPIPCPIGQDEF